MANDIADGKTVAVLLTVIGTKAYTLLKNIVAPDKPATKEYNQLVEAFRVHLDLKPITIVERFKFHCRNQHEGESMAQYIAELRKLIDPHYTVQCIGVYNYVTNSTCCVSVVC